VPVTVNAPSLAGQAYETLRTAIVTLDLAPGAPVTEQAMAERLRCGRTPVREAVQRLAAEGLVVVHPRRGTFVAPVSLTDHGFLCDVRRELEGLAAFRAAGRATEADRRDLNELASTVRRHPGGRRAAMQLDTLVHRRIHAACHNPYLAADLDRYYHLSLRIWYLFLDRLPEVDHRTEHLPVLAAILEGRADDALAGAREHVTHFERSVRRLT
jgi:DNA-binding GntR family transcriptional regulator